MNNLPGHEAQLLAVVEDGVEVLYPGGVGGSVQDDPLPLLRGRGRHVPEGGRQHAVAPLVGRGVETSVQLGHRDRLGVDDGRYHL